MTQGHCSLLYVKGHWMQDGLLVYCVDQISNMAAITGHNLKLNTIHEKTLKQFFLSLKNENIELIESKLYMNGHYNTYCYLHGL